jgi:hypothetical protein
MARKKRKAQTPQNAAPASVGYADSVGDFTCTNAVESGQVTAAKVYKRRDRLDDLLSRHVINGEGWRVLNAYRTAWEQGSFDRSRSCLDSSVGNGDGLAVAIIMARRLYAEMRARVPAICKATLDAVVIDGRTLEAVALARSSGARAGVGALAAVRDELRRSVEALMVRA